MTQAAHSIRAVVFDLDGTLYVSTPFAGTIQDVAARYIAGLNSIDTVQACRMLDDARNRMTQDTGSVPTLSAVCTELGGNIRDLHVCFETRLRPESYLIRDERVIALLEHLKKKYALFLFTNNNRALTTRIIDYLGLNGLFRRIYAIDDTWQAKPDQDILEIILTENGLAPQEALFVGDRYDIDLRLPEQHGCPVYLSQTIEQLLRLEELLTSSESENR